ncbi:hypothetical protein [Micromonospora sp. NPDC049679]|uniref:toxin-antitoxin system YwqK family antitoxin n=1 Tax=Micromonospora sp. NPDC049679 TaxID=3155920 RepID=UPI003403F3EC
MSETRINIDDLDWDDSQRAIVDERLVTGEVAEYDANGELIAVIGYRDGLKHGSELHYFPGGKLQYRGEWANGRAVGVHHAWYLSGQMAEEHHYSDEGWPVEVLKWSEDGTLIRHLADNL